MEITIDTKHLKVLEDFFDDLSKEDQSKVWMTAYRKAAKPLVAAAKANAPIGKSGMVHGRPHPGGQLFRSIGTQENPSNVSIMVGALRSKKGWYGHFTESGTKMRQNKKGANRGKVNATHWFENAYDSTEDQVYGAIQGEWENAINKKIDWVNTKMRMR